MEDAQVVLTNILSVFSGVAVVYISEVLRQKYIVPKEKLRKLKEETSIVLVNEADYYSNPGIHYGTEYTKTLAVDSSRTVRKMGAKLRSFSTELKDKGIGGISKKDIVDASGLLIRISNSYWNEDLCVSNNEDADTIKKLLKLEKKEK